MVSSSSVFDPSDLDYGHVSNVIVRSVQASLTPRIQSGRGDAMLVPKYISRFYRDCVPVSGDLASLDTFQRFNTFISGCFIPSK